MFLNWSAAISFLALLLLGVGLPGCSHQGRYAEQYELSNLNVVFLDQQSLRDQQAPLRDDSGRKRAAEGREIEVLDCRMLSRTLSEGDLPGVLTSSEIDRGDSSIRRLYER